MINLDNHVKDVWAAKTTEQKREAFKNLLAVSHAKSATKISAMRSVNTLTGDSIDKFAANFAFSGYGMSVK